MSLLDKINTLEIPNSTNLNTFSAKEIKKNSNHLIGINFNNEIAILFDSTEPKSKGDALEYIQLIHNQNALFKMIKKNKIKILVF